MKETTITLLCTLIVLFGVVILCFTYEPEFKKTTLKELLNSKEENAKGLVFARVDFVIKNYPTTQIIINDGTSAKVYYPKESKINKNDFLYLYLEKEDKNNFYAYRVVLDD